MYLISAETGHHASAMAQEKNLRPHEYVFVPYDPTIRDAILAGRRALKKENLIGDFTEEETQCLLMP